MTDIKHILSKLGWPDQAADHRGTIVWTAASGDGEALRATSASVLVNDAAIRARVRSAEQGSTGLEPHLDACWTLDGAGARLTSLVIDGQAQDPDDERAIEVFQEAVNRIGARPVFQQMAARKAPEPARNTTP